MQLAILLIAFFALGCSGTHEHVVTLADWTFIGPDGATVPLHLPARVDARLPHADTEYHLVAHVALPPELRGPRHTRACAFLPARASGAPISRGGACRPISRRAARSIST